jgi:flagellar basal body P-ring formation protein FlgA
MRRAAAFAAAMLSATNVHAVEPFAAVPVPAVTLYAGDVLSQANLATRRYRVSFIERRGFLRDAGPAIGSAARRTLPKGVPFTAADIGPASLVREGAMVLAIVRDGGLELSARMMALDGGAKGAFVRLRNPETGAIVGGTVDGNGNVAVTP